MNGSSMISGISPNAVNFSGKGNAVTRQNLDKASQEALPLVKQEEVPEKFIELMANCPDALKDDAQKRLCFLVEQIPGASPYNPTQAFKDTVQKIVNQLQESNVDITLPELKVRLRLS